MKPIALDAMGGELMPETAVIGAGIAAAEGIPMSTHLYPEVAAHMMRVTDTAHWLEWQDWAEPILKRPYIIENGYLQIPDALGLGIEWDEDFIASHLVET